MSVCVYGTLSALLAAWAAAYALLTGGLPRMRRPRIPARARRRLERRLEDLAGWVTRNAPRGRRERPPVPSTKPFPKVQT